MKACVAALFMAGTVAADVSLTWSTGSGYAPLDVEVGEFVQFNYTTSHDLYQFNSEAAYLSCNFNDAVLLGGRSDGGIEIPAPAGVSYYGCSVGSHCSRSNQKIQINAGTSKVQGAAQTISWSTGSGYASTQVDVGEEVTFVYSSSHDVWQFDDFAAYQACDFSRATNLAGRTDSPFTITAPPGNSYYGCDVGSHCTSGNQKIELVAPALKTASQSISWSTGSGYAATNVAVGEEITFVYSTSHDLWQFDDFAAYEACDFSRATQIAGRTDSPFTVVAPPGNSYYGCDVGSHCSSGNQKIELVAPAALKSAAAQTISWSTGSGYASTNVATGEEVTFVYSSSHDVWQFDDFAAYQACDFSRATNLAGRTDSPFTINAPAGNSYYGCDVGTHCRSGNQKIEIVGN